MQHDSFIVIEKYRERYLKTKTCINEKYTLFNYQKNFFIS